MKRLSGSHIMLNERSNIVVRSVPKFDSEKSCANRSTRLYSPPLPPLLTYGPKHENFKADAVDLHHLSFILKKLEFKLKKL